MNNAKISTSSEIEFIVGNGVSQLDRRLETRKFSFATTIPEKESKDTEEFLS